ncbi:MAG: hypothetical protein KF832_26235 [Caldilineaceae bacterium]|nr:hypothetical protein [Caldilineaceae bacterium]
MGLSSEVARAELQIQSGTTPTVAFLQLGDRILLDRPGFHLSRPLQSPDGRWLAATLVPSGAGTAALAETYLFAMADGTEQARLPGYSPRWSADSQQLTLETETATLVYQLATQQLEQVSIRAARNDELADWAQSQQPLAYPETIRVAHHPSNGCRDVADWQVDVIPFETYVAQVLPAEVPASWPAAALEAMAVAARTYAWRQILVGRPTYDLTDWANFQMMCLDRYPSTDAAVTATAGQYLTAKNEMPGLPISAMYSAENGHPTLTNPNVTYLQAVPDSFALGRSRAGHGYGLSQWGAYRRARAGQNYRQILGHYYSAVHLQNGRDAAQPAAALVGLLPQMTVATDRIRLATLLPQAASPRLVITASAGLTAPVTLFGEEVIWQAPVSLADTTILTAQLWLQEQLHDQVRLLVDHSAPAAPPFSPPAMVDQPLLTLAFPVATDTTPMIDTGWAWQGEELLHYANSGVLVADPQAADGQAWLAQAGVQTKGVWYGPRTTLLPAGHPYRALFWLRAGSGASAAVADQVVARLDVTDDEGRVPLGLRDLWTSDFANPMAYQPIVVDFYLFQPPVGLEFRVAWAGLVDLALDRVEIWRLPNSSDGTQHQLRFPLNGRMGEIRLPARQMDRAGNLSAVMSKTVQLVDQAAPLVGAWPLSTTWFAIQPLTVAIPVTDTFSGLDQAQTQATLTSAIYSTTLPLAWSTTALPWQSQPVTLSVAGVPDGHYALTLQVADRAGNLRTQPYPLGVDTQPPVVAAFLPLTPTQGWHGTPVTVTLVATDTTSGVATISYTGGVGRDTGAIQQGELQPGVKQVAFITDGVHSLTYWAVDRAGNQSPSQSVTVAIDLAAPTVLLQQYPLRTNRTQLTWQITDRGSGVGVIEMEIQQGEGDWEPAPWPLTAQGTVEIDLDPANVTSVRVRAQDQVGRQSAWMTLTIFNATTWLYLPWVQQ